MTTRWIACVAGAAMMGICAVPAMAGMAARAPAPVFSPGQRADAAWQIQNRVSRHDYLHAAGHELEDLDNNWVSRSGPYAATASFATPDWVVVGLEVLHQNYVKAKERNFARALENYAKLDSRVENKPENIGAGGDWFAHQNTTPIIEIAGDGKTAQGAWYAPGIGVLPAYRDGKVYLRTMVYYEKYGADFVLENGQWKIWHIQIAFDLTPTFPKEMLDQLVGQSGGFALPEPVKAQAPDTVPPALPPGTRAPLYRYPRYTLARPSIVYPKLPAPYYSYRDTYNNCNCQQDIPPPLLSKTPFVTRAGAVMRGKGKVAKSMLAACVLMGASPSVAAASGAAPTGRQAAQERSEILQLYNWTMIAFDNHDFRAFLAHFADDGVFEVKDTDPARNVRMTRAQMVETFLKRAGGPGGERHLSSNISIVLSDDRHATLNGYAAFMKPTGGGGFSAAAISSYDIVLEKAGGKWVFKHYLLVHSGVDDGASPLAGAQR